MRELSTLAGDLQSRFQEHVRDYTLAHDQLTVTVAKADFQQFAKEKKITSETIVFNNMVNTKEDFETKWEVTANQSWHKRFLV